MDIRFSKKSVDTPRAWPFRLYVWHWKFEDPAPGFHGDWRGPFLFKWLAKRHIRKIVNKQHARQHAMEQARLKAEKMVKMYDVRTGTTITIPEGN